MELKMVGWLSNRPVNQVSLQAGSESVWKYYSLFQRLLMPSPKNNRSFYMPLQLNSHLERFASGLAGANSWPNSKGL